jgi:hypothetical protein
MTQEECRKGLIEKILKRLDSRYVTIQHLEKVFAILNNA